MLIRWRRCERNSRPGRLHGVTTFPPPDFTQPKFADAPDARFAPAPADGVLPDGFFSTTNLPTFVRLNGAWRAPREPRMDAGLVLESDGTLWVREGRRLKRGDMVAVGDKEDGSEGIFVQTHLVPAGVDPDAFTFMSSEVSREKPIDYAHMAQGADRGEGARRLPDLGDGTGARAFARALRHGVVHRQRIRRRAARRQRRRRARHRGVDLRHHARHVEHRRDHAGRSRAAHARDQPRARRRFDRQRGASRESSRMASCTRA